MVPLEGTGKVLHRTVLFTGINVEEVEKEVVEGRCKNGKI
jgi:hypothetical protein